MSLTDRFRDSSAGSHSASEIEPACIYRVVALAASFGGIAALSAVLSALPADFALPILVVQHLPPKVRSRLPAILKRGTPLRVQWAEAGKRPQPGTVYVAPPDRHLLVAPDGVLAFSNTERINFSRPSADVLLRSIATVYGERAIAAILTGKGMDGARGLQAVRECGGMTIAQNEATAAAFDMPGAVIDFGKAEIVLPPASIAVALRVLSGGESGVHW